MNWKHNYSMLRVKDMNSWPFKSYACLSLVLLFAGSIVNLKLCHRDLDINIISDTLPILLSRSALTEVRKCELVLVSGLTATEFINIFAALVSLCSLMLRLEWEPDTIQPQPNLDSESLRPPTEHHPSLANHLQAGGDDSPDRSTGQQVLMAGSRHPLELAERGVWSGSGPYVWISWWLSPCPKPPARDQHHHCPGPRTCTGFCSWAGAGPR